MSERGTAAAVRWRDDVGWEYRCEDCARRQERRFWPLTDEFWHRKRGMRRCRACWKAYDRADQLARWNAMPELKREHRRAQQRASRKANPQLQRLVEQLRWQQTKADPVRLERARATGRRAMRTYRRRSKLRAEIAACREVA